MTRIYRMQFVDTHFHIFLSGIGQVGARYVPAYDAPLARWQALAEPVGVTHGVLVQPSFLGTDNQLMLSALLAHRRQLRGVAVLAPTASATELRAMHDAGVCGIRLNLSGQSHRLDDWQQAHALWDVLLELGWHVELHTDRGALPDVLLQLPRSLPLVIDHMGKPEQASAHDATCRAVCHRMQSAPVWVKLSGAYRLGGCDASALAKLWCGELGVDRLVWGSDWPCTNHETQADYPRLLAQLTDWVGPERVVQVAQHNAQKLYFSTMDTDPPI